MKLWGIYLGYFLVYFLKRLKICLVCVQEYLVSIKYPIDKLFELSEQKYAPLYTTIDAIWKLATSSEPVHTKQIGCWI